MMNSPRELGAPSLPNRFAYSLRDKHFARAPVAVATPSQVSRYCFGRRATAVIDDDVSSGKDQPPSAPATLDLPRRTARQALLACGEYGLAVLERRLKDAARVILRREKRAS